MSGSVHTPNGDRKKLAYEGKDHATAAVACGPDCWQAHMFMGCLYGVCSGFEMMNKLGSAKEMKKEFELACELCGDCPEPYHSLGQAEFGFAEAGTAARMMGLKGSYDKALELFQKAESLCPHPCYANQGGHYNTNWLMIVKTMLALKKKGTKEETKQWLQKLLDAEPQTPDDRKALVEGQKITIKEK